MKERKYERSSLDMGKHGNVTEVIYKVSVSVCVCVYLSVFARTVCAREDGAFHCVCVRKLGDRSHDSLHPGKCLASPAVQIPKKGKQESLPHPYLYI